MEFVAQPFRQAHVGVIILASIVSGSDEPTPINAQKRQWASHLRSSGLAWQRCRAVCVLKPEVRPGGCGAHWGMTKQQSSLWPGTCLRFLPVSFQFESV